MITCPCGMTVDIDTAWPPYRTVIKNAKGEITYALCIHGVVVIDVTKEKVWKELIDFWNDFGGE